MTERDSSNCVNKREPLQRRILINHVGVEIGDGHLLISQSHLN
jgi:hypothetical protein